MSKILRTIQRIEKIIGTSLIALILCVVTANIVMRYFFHKPLNWSNELSTYSLVWISYFSITYIFSTMEHVSFTFLLNRMSQARRAVMQIIINILIIVSMLTLIPSSINNMGYMIPSPSLKIPEQYIYAIVPFSYMLISVFSVFHIIDALASIKTASNKETA